jgi:dCMP deaminase
VATRLTRDQYFLQMVALVASRCTCPRRQVGAIITTVEGQILSTGYNGVPAGFPHCTEGELHACPGTQDKHGDTSRCLAVHAEVNALLQCKRLDLAHTLYVSCTPCFECAKAICNTPIKRVVALEEYTGAGMDVLEARGIQIEVEDVLGGGLLVKIPRFNGRPLSMPPRWCDETCKGRLDTSGVCIRCGAWPCTGD